MDDTITALVLRLALGIVMFPHGAQKLLGWFGGLGLLVGFLTRVAAAGIGIIMLGAILFITGSLVSL
jgi:putative oxidoreductase